MRAAITTLLLVVCFASLSGPVLADGFIVVHPPRPGVKPIPLAVKYHHVDVKIDDQIATTTVDQVFVNPNNMQLEGTYIFPLPDQAMVSQMSMWINGVEMKAEMLPRDQANKIYTDIVRKMKDPAILEYMGNRLFRVRIFPIEPRSEKRIKIEYSEKITAESGLCTYRYPLSTEKFSSKPLNDVVINVKVRTTVPLKSLFSPTHDTDVVRKDDHNAVVGYEERNVKPDKDFILYYSISGERFGAALVASKEKTQDGHYALFVAPRHEIDRSEVIPKDMVFVIDTSGSMKEPARRPWKIDQAKAALRFCVNSLNPGDRFNIVSFATAARQFRKTLQPVSGDTRAEAISFVDAMEAGGGTNIHDAMRTALAMQGDDPARPFIIVFLTDGEPTAGEIQKPDDLVAYVRKNAGASTRLFVFGVGYDVNTHLLDKMAAENRGDRMYVSPEESVEVKVASFQEKISYPVLSDVKVAINGVETYDIYPPSLPDLFRGSQLVIYGRYTGSGHAAIRLTGTVQGKPTELVYEVAFPAESKGHETIPRLWAMTKVGFLLDQLRLKGVNVSAGHRPSGPAKELVDEIVALATEFGIITPYTALLVLEDSARPTASGRPGGPATPAARRLAEAKDKDEESVEEALDEADEGLVSVTGEASVKASREANRLKGGSSGFLTGRGRKKVDQGETYLAFDRAMKMKQTFKQIGGKTFVLVHDVWYDSVFKEGMATTKVTFLSDEYFDLLSKHSALGRYLSAGSRVVVCLGDKVFEIVT